MYINIKERVDVNQDGPSLIIAAPPPTYEKLTIYCFSLLYLCLQCAEVFMTL